MQRKDNYQIQARQAQKRFLTYDQQELIERCRLKYDEEYLYLTFMGEPYRICRRTGQIDRRHAGKWISGSSFSEVMTILDWLCDSRPDRFITGRWVNIVSQSHNFHSGLQQERDDPDAALFAENPVAFGLACQALGGKKEKGGDLSYAIELLDGLCILVQLWFADEEFAPCLRLFWDENATRYIRYETTWYASGLLMQRIRENMPLETRRLILRPWQPEDAETLYTYASDPDVGTPAGWPAHTSVENSRQIIASVLSTPHTYAVCLKENNHPIGSIGLKQGDNTDMTDREDECELGYWLGKPWWGQGLIPEAAQVLLTYAFEKLGMRAVWCGYYEGNEKSRRVQEKLGFAYRYTTYDLDVPLLGERRTGHTSLLTAEAWMARRK